MGLSQVQGRVYLNKVFHISASKMFELLFSDSTFIRRFMNVRKITSKTPSLPKSITDDKFVTGCKIFKVNNNLLFSDASFTPWQKDASGNTERSLNYTITINNPLIGKFSGATENQVC